MARLVLNWRMFRQGLGGSGLFLILVVAAFGVVVFFLFRGHSSGPQDAAANEALSVPVPVERTGESMPALAAAAAPEERSAPVQGRVQPVDRVSAPALATDPQNPEIDQAIAEAVKLIRSEPGEVIAARNRLNELLQASIAPQQRQTIQEEMAKLSKDWLFGPAAFPGDMLCDTYTVKRGDLLDVIGRRLKVPYEILMQINGIQRAQNLQAGRALKVIHGPFRAKICRSTFALDLYLQDMYVRSFRVGLGAPGSETPTGLWRVKEGGKLIQPPWYDERTKRTYKATDPDYPLGTRWIALEGLEGNAKGRIGFAIHGTKDPDQIGMAASQGCVRMFNGEAELMYNLLVPVYSQVEVCDIDY